MSATRSTHSLVDLSSKQIIRRARLLWLSFAHFIFSLPELCKPALGGCLLATCWAVVGLICGRFEHLCCLRITIGMHPKGTGVTSHHVLVSWQPNLQHRATITIDQVSSTCAGCVWPKFYLARLACSEHHGKDGLCSTVETQTKQCCSKSAALERCNGSCGMPLLAINSHSGQICSALAGHACCFL